MAALNGPADWDNFANETSLHGVRYINIKTISAFRRVLWFIFTFGVMIFFTYVSYGLIKNYADKKLITRVSVERASQLSFPTVTICNENMWTYSQKNRTRQWLGGGNEIFHIFDDLFGLEGELPPPVGKYNWTSDPALATIAALKESDTHDFLRLSANSKEKTFLRCAIEEHPVNCSNIIKDVPTDQGICFQFNSEGKLKAKSPGKSGGIQFILDVQSHEYTTGPYSLSEGFAVALHEPNEVPLVTELAYGVAPGFESSIAISKSAFYHYPPPADGGKSNCYDTEVLPNPLHYYQHYSYSGCIVECKTAYVINKCGCRDMLQPALNGTKLCLVPVMLNCSHPALEKFLSDPEGLVKCKCEDPCIESQYSASVTNYKFPSKNGIKQQNLTSLGYHDNESETSLEYMKDNVVVIDIFYKKMSYQRIDEEPAIDILTLISSLGGTLGLCVGASFLTFYEFIEFFILRIYRSCKEKPKVAPV